MIPSTTTPCGQVAKGISICAVRVLHWPQKRGIIRATISPVRRPWFSFMGCPFK